MKISMVPTLIEFSEEYIEPIFGQKKPALFLFRAPGDATSDFSQAFEKASQSLKGEILFVVSGVTEGIQGRLAEFIGVDESQIPTLRLLDPSENMKKYKFPLDISKLSVENIKAFLNDFKNANLKAFLKSAPAPEDNSKPLKTVVGSTFENIVLASDDDVFVKFYAPWCGHCKSMAPAWE
jgi:thiol-disulfide isomerase/thioredoxin